MGAGLAAFARIAALLCLPVVAAAQDVTLTSRNGALSVSGTLNAYDGEFYRISSSYGPLTIDAAGVVCEGPACPDLTAPRAQIRLVGDAEAGARLIPPLIAAFAEARGLTLTMAADAAQLIDPATGSIAAEMLFTALPPDAARTALAEAKAELVVARFAGREMPARVVALDALVPITAPQNPVPRISTTDLARVLRGEVDNWQALGGPDMPLVLHGLEDGSDIAQALAARLGKAATAAKVHPDLASLAAAVARDPWALAVTGRANSGAARTLPLTDSCGFVLQTHSLAVKSEDYPLTLPVYLLTPQRRLPLMARQFLDFLAMPAAQGAIAGAGFVERSPERMDLSSDGLRLMNAIGGAGEDVALDDLKALVTAMAGAERLSLTFRFEDGSDVLDAASAQNLADLAQGIEAGLYAGETVTLVGFSDGTGAAKDNLDLARKRAEGVAEALAAIIQKGEGAPELAAFGEALPMACDETAAGRRLNRRVEVWLRPKIAAAAPAP